MSERESLSSVAAEVVKCRKCPRLVEWRESVAADPPLRHRGEDYWAKPVTGFGDPKAALMVVGLAPAAQGGNRTGRVFTGDRSGDWLFRALFKAGFANQASSTARDDGLELNDCYVTAIVRCAPPGNRPTPVERDNCLPYLVRELRLMTRIKVIVALGAFGWDGVLRAVGSMGVAVSPKPKFGHLSEVRLRDYSLIGSFHPSQQNTFTKRLTEEMFDRVFERSKELIER